MYHSISAQNEDDTRSYDDGTVVSVFVVVFPRLPAPARLLDAVNFLAPTLGPVHFLRGVLLFVLLFDVGGLFGARLERCRRRHVIF